MNEPVSKSTDSVESTTTPIKGFGAVILAGGKSSRLGKNKGELPFRDATILDWVVRSVAKVAESIVVVGPIDFAKHQLPSAVICVEDEQSDRGPMEGIRVGLQRLHGECELAFVTSCDAPLLKPELIRFLYRSYIQQAILPFEDSLGPCRGIVPVAGSRVYGMTAIYQTSIHDLVATRIEDGMLRVSDLATACFAHLVDVESLKSIDPSLDSFTNINSMEDYQNLLHRG